MKKFLPHFITRETILLFIILAIGAFFRFHNSNKYFPFNAEQADDLIMVRTVWENIKKGEIKRLPFRGQEATIDPARKIPKNDSDDFSYDVYHGAFYYYLLLLPGVISNFHPYGLVAFLIALGVFSCYLAYKVGKELWDGYTGLICAFLFAVLYPLVLYSRWIWTPSTLYFFSLLGLYSLIMISKGRERFWFLLAFSSGVITQIHNAGYFFLVFVVISLLILKLRLPKNRTLKFITIGTFGLTLAPTLIIEVLSKFFMTRQIIARFILSSSPGTFSPDLFLKGVFSYFWNFVKTTFNYGNLEVRIEIVLLLLFAIFPILALGLKDIGGGIRALRINKLLSKKTTLLFLVWLIIFLPLPFLIRAYYATENRTSWYNNLLTGTPILVVLISLLIRKLATKVYFAPLGIALFLVLIAVNSLSVKSDLWKNKSGDFTFFDDIQIINMIEKDREGLKYAVEYKIVDEKVLRTEEILFLMQLLGHELPETYNGGVTWAQPEFEQKLRGESADISYVIIDSRFYIEEKEPKPGIPLGRSGPLKLYRGSL